MTVSQIIDILEEKFSNLDLEINDNLDFGTLSSKIAFKERIEGMKPFDVASQYVIKMNEFATEKKLPITVSNKGPFINIIFTDKFYSELLENGIDRMIQNNFNVKQDKSVIFLEYISPNMAKPLHAGHLLQGNFGQSLKNILGLKYLNLSTNAFLGDWGVNLGTLIWGYKQILGKTVKVMINNKLINLTLDKNPSITQQVYTYVWANQQKDNTDDFDTLVRAEHLKLENNDPENLEIWKNIRKSTLESTKKVLNKIDIDDFDYWEGEQSTLETVNELVDYIKTNNIGVREGKGVYVQFDEINDWENTPKYCQKNIKQLGRAYLLESKTGYTTYILRDIAAKIDYARKHEIDKLFAFVGNEQIHNFYQVFALCDYIGKKPSFIDQFGLGISNKMRFETFTPVFNGMVSTPEGKMSTRKGNFVLAESIVDKISIRTRKVLEEKGVSSITDQKVKSISNAALKWFNLSKEISSDTVLDVDQILNFSGNTGVYQLYTFSRLNSILDNFKEISQTLDISTLSESEIKILQKISISELVINSVINNHKIHILTNYLFELCQLINSWYNSNSVLHEKDNDRQDSLVFMIVKSKTVIEKLLALLGINTIDKL